MKPFFSSIHGSGLERRSNPRAPNTSNTQTVVSKYHFPLKEISFEEMRLSPGLEQEIHKMIREHLVTLQSNRSINASQETTDKE